MLHINGYTVIYIIYIYLHMYIYWHLCRITTVKIQIFCKLMFQCFEIMLQIQHCYIYQLYISMMHVSLTRPQYISTNPGSKNTKLL